MAPLVTQDFFARTASEVFGVPIETNEHQSVDGAERESLRSSPPQNIYLLPYSPNLGLGRCPRPK